MKDPERYDMVLKMWRLMLTGAYTPEMIAKIASKEWGLTTLRRKKLGGNPISRSVVYRVFKNRFYAGQLRNSGELFEGNHDAMVTPQEYDQVQKILGRKGNPRAYKKEFPFSGLVQCGECGCSITAEEKRKYLIKKEKVKTYVYMHCTKKKKLPNGEKCTQRSIEQKELEKQISTFLEKIEISDRFLEWAKKKLRKQTDVEITTQEQARKNLEKKFQNCTKALNNLIKLKISPENSNGELLSNEEFSLQKKTLIKEQKEAEKNLNEWTGKQHKWIDLTAKTFEFCSVAKKKFETGTIWDKRRILRCVGSNLFLKDGKLTIEPKKVFKLIEKHVERGSLEETRFEPAETRIDKPQNGGLDPVCSTWRGERDSWRTGKTLQ